MEWKNIYRGVLMGISNVIPGVSAGTIALILGIYDQLIGAVSDFFSPKWRQTLNFLIPLGIGVLAGIIGFIQLISWLLDNHFQVTQFFFLGLILGVIPFMFIKAEMKKRFTAAHYIIIVLMALLVAMMGVIPEDGSGVFEMNMFNAVRLFVAGWLASMSLLLPGISGAVVLLMFGVYDTAVEGLSAFNFDIIVLLGAGIVIGFIMSSKIIKYVLKEFPYMTYAVIIGLLAGSLIIVYPGFGEGSATVFPSLITFTAGTVTALYLGRSNH